MVITAQYGWTKLDDLEIFYDVYPLQARPSCPKITNFCCCLLFFLPGRVKKSCQERKQDHVDILPFVAMYVALALRNILCLNLSCYPFSYLSRYVSLSHSLSLFLSLSLSFSFSLSFSLTLCFFSHVYAINYWLFPSNCLF